MADRTEAQRKARRDYQRKRYARLRKEKEQAEAVSDAQIKAAAARLGADVERDYGPNVKVKRAAKAPAGKRMAYMIPRLVELTLALRKAGCRMAICTLADGSKITLR